MRRLSPAKYVVIAKLRVPYKIDFVQFTGGNIGKRIDVIACCKTIVSAVIKGRIDTGVIQIGFWKSWEEAIRFGNELIAKDGKENCDELTRLLMVRYHDNGNDADAFIKYAMGCLGEFEEHGDKVYLNKGLNYINEAIRAAPDYERAYYWKAFILCKLNEMENATKALDEGIRRSASDVTGERARLYMFRGALNLKSHNVRTAYIDYGKAVSIYRRSLAMSPKDQDAMMNLGIALVLMNKRSDAFDFAKGVEKAYPDRSILRRANGMSEAIQYKEISDGYRLCRSIRGRLIANRREVAADTWRERGRTVGRYRYQ